jgi:hypothetical protein
MGESLDEAASWKKKLHCQLSYVSVVDWMEMVDFLDKIPVLLDDSKFMALSYVSYPSYAVITCQQIRLKFVIYDFC